MLVAQVNFSLFEEKLKKKKKARVPLIAVNST